MKNLFYIAFSAIVLVSVYAFGKSVWISKPRQKKVSNFIKELGKKPYNCKKRNKLIFLDIYATWCGPCVLKQTPFQTKKLEQFYTKNFVNVAFDGEQGDGAMLMQK